ncbi:MAG: glycerol-3-phosphate 1-O-acyltransferase PlsY [Burkholderiales bacterium]|nr:glycerol-3-phosphate 1-O-acyltransferase PlsY [Burkholderiales bacterium]
MTFGFPLLVLVGGYLVGSLAFAVLVSRAMGLADPRSYGSGNPGATNVLRSGSKPAALATLALDALKGVLPVLAARWGAVRLGLSGDAVEWSAALAGFGAFVGHLWPLYFRFKGGKGVATAAGVLLAINPWLGLATLATWLIIAAFFRYSSLASLVSAAFAPFYQFLIWGAEPGAAIIVVMSLLLAWRHAPNIAKLLAGTESRIGGSAGTGAKRKAPAKR